MTGTKKKFATDPAYPSDRVGSGWEWFDMPDGPRVELSDLVHAHMPYAEFAAKRSEFWDSLGARLGFVPSTVQDFGTSVEVEGIVGFWAQRVDIVPPRDDGPALAWLARREAEACDAIGIAPADRVELSDMSQFVRADMIEAWHAGRAAAIADWAERGGLRPDGAGANIARESGDQMHAPIRNPEPPPAPWWVVLSDFAFLAAGLALMIGLDIGTDMPAPLAMAVGGISSIAGIRVCDWLRARRAGR